MFKFSIIAVLKFLHNCTNILYVWSVSTNARLVHSLNCANWPFAHSHKQALQPNHSPSCIHGLFLQMDRWSVFANLQNNNFFKKAHNGRHGAWLSLICSTSFQQRRILMRHPFKGYQTHMLGAFAICSGALYALYVLGYGESPNVHLWLLVMAFFQKNVHLRLLGA